MLTDSAGYGIRKELIEWTIKVCPTAKNARPCARTAITRLVLPQTFLNVYLDSYSPLRSRLLYVVNKGEPEKAR
jgi:hypothetical protein